MIHPLPSGPGVASASAISRLNPRLVAAARGAATALYLERTLKQGTLVPAENEPAAFALIQDGKVQAYAQNRSMLIGLAQRVPVRIKIDQVPDGVRLVAGLTATVQVDPHARASPP